MIAKELRALLPTWLAGAVGLAAGATDFPVIRGAGVLVYFLTSAALGATAFGHEYTYRTMGLLLSQPVPRRRIFLIKIAVLAALLLALRLLFGMFRFGRIDAGIYSLVLWLPLLGGLFLAPALTLLFRAPLPGAVFALAIPGILLVAGELLGVRYGHSAEAFRVGLVRWGMLVLCIGSSLLAWRTFARLEAIDGRGADVDLPLPDLGLGAASDVRRRRHPVWLLLAKELRLHHLAFAVAGLYLAGCVVAAMVLFPTVEREDAVSILSLLYGLLLAVLIGALASAEERQLGTLEWQMLLPVSAARQWMVKAGTAIGLTLLLGFGLPLVLIATLPLVQRPYHLAQLVQPRQAVILVAFTAGSLYVSSLCSSGLRALLASVAAGLAVGLFIQLVMAIFAAVIPDALHLRALGRMVLLPRHTVDWLALAVIAGLATLALRFGLENHRSADRLTPRVWRQATWMAVSLAAAVAILDLVG
jgi:hypothetical protein